MNTEKKNELKRKAEESGLSPEIRTVEDANWIKNAERTGDDRAAVGDFWKYYWQIFTQEDFPTKCPFCGETLEADKIDGCHIKIDEKRLGLDSRRWLEKKYIIPGHHDCNISYEGENQAKIRINAVEAIEKKS